MGLRADAGRCGGASEGNPAREPQRAGGPGLRSNEVRDGRRRVRGRIRGEPRAGTQARNPGTPMQ